MRKFIALMSVTVLVVAGLGSGASGQWSCPRGSICFYSDVFGMNLACPAEARRNLGYKCPGVRSYFNNGHPLRGKDHVYTRIYHPYHVGEICIHYGESEGIGIFNYPVFVSGIKWGSECEDSRDINSDMYPTYLRRIRLDETG